MSANSTTRNGLSTESWIVGYYSLFLTIIGTILNLFSFIILYRAPFRNGNNRGTLHYMRTIAIFDILMLYGWNLDHYLAQIYGLTLLRYSVLSCKVVTFVSYFTAQVSAYLRVFICIDRYFSLSRIRPVWIHRPRNTLIIIACIIILVLLLNFHILIFVCYQKINGSVAIGAQYYRFYPLWDYVNLGVYNCVPFILMVIFNSGIIHHLIRVRQTRIIRNSRLNHRSITITLVITTSLFLIMTIPATVAFAFFIRSDKTILRFLDGIFYTYHISSFPLYMFTFHEFRQECVNVLRCRKP
ncbi:unnamed protein product [Adineta ricciae]|uniref:G-protein coupled receptors family 1 profile domain-containing protein n=1 Tax=Adineta ricciae TaxID=249248 RepID=A0A813XNW3_ADIRI|nr:unnamed protein product [Adineta ricciae]CAF1562430.1 unnamed protein product [Adineta ricciae]